MYSIGKDPRSAHGDTKPSNILLNMTPTIACDSVQGERAHAGSGKYLSEASWRDDVVVEHLAGRIGDLPAQFEVCIGDLGIATLSDPAQRSRHGRRHVQKHGIEVQTLIYRAPEVA